MNYISQAIKQSSLSVASRRSGGTSAENAKNQTTANRSYVSAFQKHMKKLVNAQQINVKLFELNEIEYIMFAGGATIDTFIVDHSYYIEELVNYCRPDVGLSLRWRGIRLIASICQSSKILRDVLRKKGAIAILNESLLARDTTDEVCRWIVHGLRYLAVKDEGLSILQGQQTQNILIRMAKDSWIGWGNNDAEDLLRLCSTRKMELLKLDVC